MVGGYDKDLPQGQQEDAISESVFCIGHDPNSTNPALEIHVAASFFLGTTHNAMQCNAAACNRTDF